MPTSEHLALVVTWLLFLQLVAFGAKLVNLVEHPFEQGVSRGVGYSRMLKLPDVTAQSRNLTAAVLDVSTDEIDVRHAPTPGRTKQLPILGVEHIVNKMQVASSSV
jgi:hypothetical protein